ncbi:LysR family transcriptional regulator [Paenibacillus cremeus]|uniref:LysR family transcriptional regulator n=1 Tax=Paenibacillus cremeus TaxID=2163881 RepID=A0A559KDE0_9BACL|nr:LysR family transcriptional regulator [Paenibacillus cremeus]
MFYEIAQTGSLSKAAERLFITQPSVSYAVKQLEEQLNTMLFLRKSKGVELTPEGRALLEYVQPAMLLLGEGERMITQVKSLEAGEIRIGGSEIFIKQYLLSTVEAFHRKHPGIKFSFIHGKTQEIVRALEDGRIDLGMVHLPLANAGTTISILEDWLAEPIFICGSQTKYAALCECPSPSSKHFKEPLIVLSSGSSTRRFIEQEAMRCGVQLMPEMVVGSVDLIKELVRMGIGIAVIHRDLVEHELNKGVLLEMPLVQPLPQRSIGIATSSKRSLSAAAAAFMQMRSSG